MRIQLNTIFDSHQESILLTSRRSITTIKSKDELNKTYSFYYNYKIIQDKNNAKKLSAIKLRFYKQRLLYILTKLHPRFYPT